MAKNTKMVLRSWLVGACTRHASEYEQGEEDAMEAGLTMETTSSVDAGSRSSSHRRRISGSERTRFTSNAP
jgi:hypothetical protein